MKIVYTFDESYLAKVNLPFNIVIQKALTSVSKFVSPKDIIIFYTGSNYNYIKLLSKYDIRIKPNLDSDFNVHPSLQLKLGNKLYVTTVKDKEVIFLDVDTVVKKDITQLFNNDFDLAFRLAPSFKHVNLKAWNECFKKFELEPMPMPNAGFILFKDYSHLKIRDSWFKFLNSDLPQVFPSFNPKEQFALALAVRENRLKFWFLEAKHIAFMNEGEAHIESYVYHFAGHTKHLMAKA